ncbi:MAG TPA: glucosyltransferase domain-containing protein, partial [Actinophytocola sp.]|nr:glucosyltransferase domain-containing protein [Actinophytocola sp.]
MVPFVVWGWAALNGYFGQDDFIITHRAAHASPWELDYLFQDYSGHLQPGAFLLAWLATTLAPLNHTVAMVPLLATHAVTLVLCWRVLVRLFQKRWAIVPAFVVFSCSPLILFPTLWWAYAMQLLPLLLAMFAALLAHLRYLDSGRVRSAVTAGVWVLVGLAFYEKAALVPALLFAVTVLRTGQSIIDALLRHRWVWAGYAAIVAGYAALYLALTADQGGEQVTSRTILEFAYKSVVHTFLPGLLGGPLTGSGGGAAWATPPLGVRIAAVVLAAGLVVLSALRSRRRALLPWLFLAGYLVVDLTLVAATRLGEFGPVIATDPRYLADAVPVAVLCAMFAFLPAGRTRPDDEQPRNATRLAAAGLTVVLAA